MTVTDPLAGLRRSETMLDAAWTVLRHAVGWPGRVRRARRLLAQLGRMEAHRRRR